MKTLLRLLRTLFVAVLVTPLVLPVAVYIAMSSDTFRGWVAAKAESELTALLGSEVKIGGVSFAPFNRVVFSDVSVADSLGQPVLKAGHLGAGISFTESLWNSRPVITYAELIDVDLRLWRDSVGAPLNIDPLIAKFKKKDSRGPSAFDLSVNMVVIRRSALSYNVLNAPPKGEGRFDPAHISLSDLRADLRAPRISNGNFEVEIKRMGAFELSGLTLSNLSAAFEMDSSAARLNNLAVEMPSSMLRFDNIEIPSPLAKGFNPRELTTRIATLPDTYVAAADLEPLLPVLGQIGGVIDLELEAEGSLGDITVGRLSASMRGGDTYIATHGTITGLGGPKDSIELILPRLNVNVSLPKALSIISSSLSNGPELSRKLEPLSHLGRINLMAQAAATAQALDFDGAIATDLGNIDFDGIVDRPSAGVTHIAGSVDASEFNPSEMLPALAQLTAVTLSANCDISLKPKGEIEGTADATIPSVTWKGDTFTDLTADARIAANLLEFNAASASPGLEFSASGERDLKGEAPATQLFADLRNVDLSHFLTKGKFANSQVSGSVDLSVTGTKPDNIDGWARIADLTVTPDENGPLSLGNILVDVSRPDSTGLSRLDLTSRALDCHMWGHYTFSTLIADVRDMLATLFPAVIEPVADRDIDHTSARLHASIRPDSVLTKLLGLPVEVIDSATIKGATGDGTLSLRLDAPYLRQKDKLIEQTSLALNLDAPQKTSNLLASTIMPTKNGPMNLNLLASGANDHLKADANWRIDRAKDFHGDVSLVSTFSRPGDDRKLHTAIEILPTRLVFNDSAWNVTPATIDITPGRIDVAHLGASRRGQVLSVDGTASADTASRVVISLDHIDLDYVFETLAISDAVMFGGRATGKLYGDALLSRSPMVYTPRLHVDGLSYNHCVMGDADIVSTLDNSSKAITIKADIAQANGQRSLIDGYIRPASSELFFNFMAHKAPVGFMLPFMSAFTSQISGDVSGDAKLFGTFKNLDLTGKIFVDNLKMKLDFTNTVYSVSDSVTLDPGYISFKNVTLSDKYGNKAKLTGEVTHNYFHEPTFKFDITDARNLLVYDVGEHDTDDPWYGRIFGRGSAEVRGVPGRIDIGVDMTTEPKSTFTFVLTDAMESVDYDFITFRDRDRARKDSLAALDTTPEIVKQLRSPRQSSQGPPSRYVMDFNVDITPQATLNLIMDPVGGDNIVAHGDGHLQLGYDSQGELEMRGDYRLNSGYYKFTLQDIVIKDFTIREGSSIRFSGDPYAAQLDILASYSTRGNLTDLDESFLEDSELNSTNVPVNALMKVTGDMRSPEIGFDLEFPTLTSDVDRKVHSIVSTEEMMGQQIIYLLALNRFYTPEYMAATHGNELVSVASSTLSSRLGSMLGQLSDTWNIAPSIRSSRGDFSDVEVDLALSSRLLDNRLLFNGNFGYRDKSLNNNSFIGDFDIRYLLNRQGTIQLKAYNRYNDQNYYLKSALTTQGVGVVFKRDFDNIFSWLRPIRRKLEERRDTVKTQTDTVSVPADTVKRGTIVF